VVGTLRYKPEGNGFDSRWNHYSFLIELVLLATMAPAVTRASNINEYEGCILGVKTAGV
jgi:hypothetical protein